MPDQIKLKKYLIFIAVLSWGLLVGSSLLYPVKIGQSTAATSLTETFSYAIKAVFVLAVFMLQRIRVNSYKGLDLLGYLWKLFFRGGITAYVCAVLHFGYQWAHHYFTGYEFYLSTTLYALNFGFFVFFIAKAFYIWHELLLYQKTKALVFEWRLFEGALFVILLLSLFQLDFLDFIFIPLQPLLAIFVVFLSFHLKWVAYVPGAKKWRVILLLLVILASTLIFIKIFVDLHLNTPVYNTFLDNPFIRLITLFVVLYPAFSLLVAIFSLPTASVFEQKRADLLNFQRLTQLIQQGEDQAQVFKTFFESAVNASDTDAGWLELLHEEEVEIVETFNIAENSIAQIRQEVQSPVASNLDYVNNNLDNSQFKRLRLPYKSLFVTPLRTAQRTFGVLYLLKDVEQGFDRETINVIRTFVSQTNLTIENLQLAEEALQTERYKEELKIASTVQESLIPKTFPSDSWFEISCFSQAAKEVGGDFYDFLQLSEGRIAIIIGDVSGKGISAAFHMAQMKGIFHGLMQDNLEPVKFMVKANNALTHCLERTSFITSSLYIIDYKLKGIFFARAGHCHTLYYNSMTEETFYFNTEGLGLGIIRDQNYSKRIHNMHYDYNPGDVMVIYTDGIVEARNKNQEEYGEDRLREMLAQTYHLEADDIKNAVVQDVTEFSQDMPIHDDQTLLVIKFRNVQPNFSA
ncbi:PP2C family protein-serine/threonine phosphatase [Adhaeribacter rhizoryzae]|uniref:SpoIIE family protein phosphatase n=1 Tax=Adhaeribacter rhizoryzae TaxID=2607907 RepID=A0A5M6DT82_9BACT|nr:PP2C family protein-serine/threonine phosphatase [Adhaeribacter rhizoryzae]KAA5549452.1 SpoIIE family protein phosphatase [Adhaeribacter rhizoryzae]